MPLTTPQRIISFALRAIGVLGTGQTALPEDYEDAFSALNAMLAQWTQQRWLVYRLIDVAKVSTGAISYTVGPGADFDTPRPDRLEAAFFRQYVSSQPNKVDFPLRLIQAREEYNRIALKDLTSWPTAIWYDPAFPIGVVYPWPVPQASIYEIHLTLKVLLAEFSSYVQSLNMPSSCIRAVWTNLSLELSLIYPGSVVSPNLAGVARAALQTIRDSNMQIPRLLMPPGLRRGSFYNIYSDTRY